MNRQPFGQLNETIVRFDRMMTVNGYPLCDPITIGSQILSFISESYESSYGTLNYPENFSSIWDTHPRDQIFTRLEKIYIDRKDDLHDELPSWYYDQTKKLRGELAVKEWDENWDRDRQSIYDDTVDEVIAELRRKGYDDLYVTNWTIHREVVQQRYFERMEEKRLAP